VAARARQAALRPDGAQLDYRIVTRDALPAIEFTFHGFDEVTGRVGPCSRGRA
jgi:hypothetical protein